MNLNISALGEVLLEHFRQKGVTTPNHCFGNCAGIVFNLKFGNYVLCWVTDAAGHKHPHAVIEFKGAHYDPTLEGRGPQNIGYIFVKSFTRDELIQEMIKSGADYSEVEGTIGGFAPALLMDGTIKCTEAASAF